MKVENLRITKITEAQSGTSKAGKEWKKLTFVGETSEQYNNLYAFELFGEEKVDNFQKFNKEGDMVNVEFNVATREWQGKYFTSLSAWRIDKAQGGGAASTEAFPDADNFSQDSADELPF